MVSTVNSTNIPNVSNQIVPVLDDADATVQATALKVIKATAVVLAIGAVVLLADRFLHIEPSHSIASMICLVALKNILTSSPSDQVEKPADEDRWPKETREEETPSTVSSNKQKFIEKTSKAWHGGSHEGYAPVGSRTR